ncbi:multiheme c-type cytochrome [Novosphingobium sp. PS1R-30]|uniref:Multiheme c-type cytochrome n=2 Tax=Novosphingobium anseongense TaxID=3133436 RepID=A0ABU8RW59_9SPHN
MAHLRVLAMLALLTVLLLASAAWAGGTFQGVASCAGSTCHGRSEGDGKVVRQDELMQWQEPSSKGGAHSRAYAALTSPRGQKILSALSLGKAESASACLGCHATNAGAGERGGRFRLTDGVGCESCHGAASGWISSHYAVPATHVSNIAQGMIPLENPKARASVCLDCHFGSSKTGQFVTHSMMAAGHPRVAFELDLFSDLQRHWDDDADYRQRKGRGDSVRLWAVGQAEAVQRSLSLFQQPQFASEGIFPEFYFYDCHSCHRSIDDQPNRARTFETNPGRPMTFGLPPYNDENIIMLSAVAQVLAPGQAGAFDAASRQFHAAMGEGRPQAVAAASRLRAAAASLSSALAARQGSADSAFAVVDAIAGRVIAPRFTDYTGSAQAVMAVDTLLNSMVRQGRVTVGAAAGIRANINRAYAAVASPSSYDPPAFRAALGQAAGAIGSLR